MDMGHLISVGSLWPVHSGRVGPSALVRIGGEGGGEKRLRKASCRTNASTLRRIIPGLMPPRPVGKELQIKPIVYRVNCLIFPRVRNNICYCSIGHARIEGMAQLWMVMDD